MFAQLSNPLHTFALLREELLDYWETCKWKSSDEYRENVRLKLAAHQKAMAEGYESPYIDPDNYNMAWEPITIRQKTSE